MKPEAQFDSGSFRDPCGSVFYHEGNVYRAVDDETFALVERLEADGLLASLIASGRLIDTSIVRPLEADFDVLREIASGRRVLRHRAVPFVSYPCEWTFSMLADAAAEQLALQLRLLEHGYSLKDASAYNTQFLGAQAVFIDVPSIEVPARADLWIAYGQFCRMFLFPLLLGRYRAVDTKGYFLSHIDGMEVEQVYRTLGAATSLRPILLVDVFLQRLLQKRGADSVRLARAGHGTASNGAASVAAQQFNLRRLSRKIDALAASRRWPSRWSRYAAANSYSPDAEEEKASFVEAVMRRHRPRAVLDVGCNTGRYSRIAVHAGARTVAIDSDHDCVDRLYRQARDEGLDLLPVWMDVANPTPGTGFRNSERTSFLDRVHGGPTRFDLVLALALVHHLLVVSRIPLPEISRLLADLTEQWLVVEFIPVDDPMFQRLLALRENIYTHVTQEHFEQVFSTDFRIDARQKLPECGRTLYLMERNGR
ncbi:MAG: class I SAM-dependent methyltransferase [Pirellulales bacterium]|nr:class I SAM-dependent methyltransferase [Pirellulales bacterium]